MLVYEVRPSIDKDFDDFFSLVVGDEGWIEKYNKGDILVKSKWTEESRIKMIKVSKFLYENLRGNVKFKKLTFFAGKFSN